MHAPSTPPGQLNAPPDRPMSYGALVALALVVLVGASLASIRRLTEQLAPRRAWAWGALAALLAAQLLLTYTLVPFDTWHSNRRGLGMITELHAGLLGGADGLAALHGMGTHAALVLSRRLTGGQISVFGLQLGWSLLGTVAAFLFGSLASARLDRGLALALVLAMLPLRLRLSASDCMYLVPEATWLFGLAWLLAWTRARDPVQLALAAGWLTYTAHCRTEHLLLVPLSSVLVLIATPGALHAFTRSRLAWLLTLAATASYLPRLWALRALHEGAGVASMGADPRPLDALRDPHLWPLYAALCWGLWRVWRPTPAPPSRTVVLVVAALFTGLSIWPGLAPRHFQGVDLALPPVLASVATVHALVDPEVTPIAWSFAAAFGLALAVRRGERLSLAVLALAIVALWIYLPRWDNASTFVRVGLSLGWCFSWWLSGALVECVDALPARPYRLAVVPMFLLPLHHYTAWLGYRFPIQQEHALLVEARALGQAGAVVHTLHPDEVPTGWRDFTRRLDLREDPLGYLGVGQPYAVRPLGALDPADLAGPSKHYYLRGLDCYLPLLAWEGDCPDQCTWLYGVGDRLYEGPRPPFDGVQDRGALTVLAPRWDLDTQVPCRATPERAECIKPDPEGCLRWRCLPVPPETSRGAPYLDSHCAAFEQRFELRPVHEIPLATGQISGVLFTPVRAGSVLGLYEVVGPR